MDTWPAGDPGIPDRLILWAGLLWISKGKNVLRVMAYKSYPGINDLTFPRFQYHHLS